MKQVYFDNAATTPMRDAVIERMINVMHTHYGNASSTHGLGRSAKSLMETSRKTIASFLNVHASEIVFTAGGTEADNLVLRSAVRDLGVTEIITSKLEHHAVLHTVAQLQKEYNIAVTYVKLKENGMVDLNNLEQLLQSDNKVMVSLMHVNNEIGNKLDLQKVADLCKLHGALCHSDTVQSVGHYDLDLQTTPVDFIAASAHKFHGPKGIGFAFIRKGSGIKASLFGGEQERGYRAGTEAIHNIVGMETALKLSYENLDLERQHISELKTYFIDQLKNLSPEITFNGNCEDQDHSTYTVLNVCLPIPPEKGAMLHFQLDLKGIACSRGSACQSGSNQNSHVLTELLNAENLLKPSVRFSLSCFNTKAEVDYVMAVLKDFI